jgi:hypothetical protein
LPAAADWHTALRFIFFVGSGCLAMAQRPGVGGVKVITVWSGPGTRSCAFADEAASNVAASTTQRVLHGLWAMSPPPEIATA